MQKGQDGRHFVVACNSASLTPAQRNYAMIELEGFGYSMGH